MKRSLTSHSSHPRHHPTPRQRGWSDKLIAELKSSLEKLLARRETDGVRDDIVGEVLLRVIAHDRNDIRHPFAYARTAAQNLLRDRIRDLERGQRALEELAYSRRSAANDNGSTGALDNGDLLSYLLERTRLSPLQRQIVNMIYFDDRNITQAARKLGKNPGTVHRHHLRAIEKLARCARQLRS